MPLQLGTTEVSFRLGNASPAVYLGTQLIGGTTPLTLYYNAEDDTEWTNLLNWWTSDEAEVQAPRIPAATDSVIINGLVRDDLGALPGGAATVASMTVWGDGIVDLAISAAGGATFISTGSLVGALTGNAVFNDSSSHMGFTVGNVTFNNTSINDSGTVQGNAIFNNSAVNAGEVVGTATFNGSACNDNGIAGTFVPDPPPAC